MRLNLRQHAKIRQIERGISDEEVRDTIVSGVKSIQGDRLLAEKGPWAVVFRKSVDVAGKYFVITVMQR